MSDSDQTTELQSTEEVPASEKHFRLKLGNREPRNGEPTQMPDPTPILISHRTRTIILLAMLVLFVLLVRTLPGIVTTVLLGSTLALILSFPVRFLQRKLSRRLSILIVTVSMLGGTVIGLVLIIPMLISEISQFVAALPSIVDTAVRLTRDLMTDLHERGWLRQEPDDVIQDVRYGLLDSAQSILGTALNNLAGTLGASVSVFITAFGVVFVAIYLLADIPKFQHSYLRLWAPSYRTDAKVLWDTLGYSLSRYLGALLVSISIQGFMAFVGLYLLGVPYALVLGLVQAITAVLPYIGAWIAFVPSFLVALTINWQTALGVGVLYLSLNLIEGNLITPNLQGNALKVHPILIFIGVIGGGQMFGFMGAILAVPTIAILRVSLEFFWLRLHVAEDKPTLLGLMRSDTAAERLASQDDATAETEAQQQDASG